MQCDIGHKMQRRTNIMIRKRTAPMTVSVPVFMAAILWMSAAFGEPAPPSYFNMDEKKSGDITPFYKWTTMVKRFVEQRKIPDSDCGNVRFHPCSVVEWKAWLETLKRKPLHEQMEIVNSWANAYPYIVDQVNWGVEDYWETPYEFLDVSGNCKDYAIAKYYSLKALGVPVEKMRVIVLQDLNLGGIIHAVLGVYDNGELWILDNQNPNVIPALKIYHYRPLFGINEDACWAYYPK